MSPPDSTCRLWLGSLVPGHVLLCPVPNGWAEDGACNEDAHVPGDVAGGSGEEVSEIGQDCCLHGLNPPSVLFFGQPSLLPPRLRILGHRPKWWNWHTRRTQNPPPPKGVWVRVPPWAFHGRKKESCHRKSTRRKQVYGRGHRLRRGFARGPHPRGNRPPPRLA